MKKSFGVAEHYVGVFAGTDHGSKLVEVFLIERTVSGFVMQQSIFAVNGVIGTEKDFFASPSSDSFKRGTDGYPCCIAVKIRELSQQVDSLFVVGTQVHMHHNKVQVGMGFCRIVKMDRTRFLTAARMGNNRQVKFPSKLIKRL